MRFIVDIRRAVAEQEVASDQLVSRDRLTYRPKPIAILTIFPDARFAHKPGKETRAVMRHEVGEPRLLLAIAERNRARELLIHRLNLCVG